MTTRQECPSCQGYEGCLDPDDEDGDPSRLCLLCQGDGYLPEPRMADDEPSSDPVTCQGCGRVSHTAKRNDPHNCWRNEDGTYEEGGTFQ